MIGEGCTKIVEEYVLRLNEKRYFIDVVGFKQDGTSIAIECGRTPRRKMMVLEQAFTLVKKLTYTPKIHLKANVELPKVVEKPSKPLSPIEKFYSLRKAETPVGVRICVPKMVKQDFKLKRGDVIEWYPTYLGMDVPDSEITRGNVIILVIRREKRKGQSPRKLHGLKK